MISFFESWIVMSWCRRWTRRNFDRGQINCEQISLGGMKFLDRRELKVGHGPWAMLGDGCHGGWKRQNALGKPWRHGM